MHCVVGRSAVASRLPDRSQRVQVTDAINHSFGEILSSESTGNIEHTMWLKLQLMKVRT